MAWEEFHLPKWHLLQWGTKNQELELYLIKKNKTEKGGWPLQKKTETKKKEKGKRKPYWTTFKDLDNFYILYVF